MFNFSAKYILATMAYGFTRKVIHVYDATVYRNGNKNAPMLLTDKIMIVSLSTVIAPTFLPIYVYSDLNAIELSLRNEKETEYEWKYKSPFSYLP